MHKLSDLNYLFSAKAEAKPGTTSTPQTEEEPMKEDSDPESEVELELLDTVIEGDTDADSQEMGDESKEPTEEEMDQAGELRSKAAKGYSNQEFEGLMKHLNKHL
jgi:suppressor of tumorigenicity protein 13